MGTGDLCRVPQAAARDGKSRQTSGTGPCGDCRRVLYVPDPRGQYSGEIRFNEPQGVNGHRRHVFCAPPSSGSPQESQAVFSDGTVWGLWKGSVSTGPAGSVFEENSFYRQTWGTRLGGSLWFYMYFWPLGSQPRSQNSGTVLLPPLPNGESVFGKIRFIEPRGKVGSGEVRHGSARKSSGPGPCRDCGRVLRVVIPRGIYSG